MTTYPTRGFNGGTHCAGQRDGDNVSKTAKDINATLKRFKNATQGEELSSRADKKIIEEAIQLIEGLQ